MDVDSYAWDTVESFVTGGTYREINPDWLINNGTVIVINYLFNLKILSM
jgi:hypothetical protein